MRALFVSILIVAGIGAAVAGPVTITPGSTNASGNAVDASGNLIVNTVLNIQTVIINPHLGDRTVVTDATTCVFMQPVIGGGTLFCPVIWNGNQWVAD